MKSYILLIMAFLLTGCSILFGVKNIKTFDSVACEKFLSSIDMKSIKHISIYEDEKSLNCRQNIFEKNKRKQDLSQPIQMLYFQGDSLVSFQANCYAAGGVSNLNWNTDKRFDTFPPKSAVSLDSLSLNLKSLTKCNSNIVVDNGHEYTVVILWTRVLEKVSKTAIEQVISNISGFNKESEVEIVFSNTDKWFID